VGTSWGHPFKWVTPASVIGGFVPNMLNQVRKYWPTVTEELIAPGVWSVGFFVLTILYKVAVSVREETAGIEIEH